MIGIVNSGHYLWWTNQEPSICPLGAQGTNPAYKPYNIKQITVQEVH